MLCFLCLLFFNSLCFIISKIYSHFLCKSSHLTTLSDSCVDFQKCIVNDDKPTLYFSTPFLGPCSLQLKSRISRLIKQCYPSHKLRIVFSTPKRLTHFFPFKDSIPKLLRSSVVYCYKCPSCNARYYGKTSRNLAIRCREHIGVSKTGYKMNNEFFRCLQPLVFHWSPCILRGL